jgi:hypothetical protein
MFPLRFEFVFAVALFAPVLSKIQVGYVLCVGQET